jgi:hypothetical protein
VNPEDRAGKLTMAFGLTLHQHYALIAAIRAAENDALERAAEQAEKLDWDQYGMAGEVMAGQIRRMKHEST